MNAGRTPESVDWHVARSIYVADTDSEAAEFVAKSGGAYDYYFDYLFQIFDRADYRGPFIANKTDDPAALTPRQMRESCVIHGSPETVAKALLGLRERIGDFGTLLYAAHDWQDQSADETLDEADGRRSHAEGESGAELNNRY